MNIQELHNRLIKKANMQKVAGPGADKLRKIIADINKVRSDKNLVAHLNKSPLLEENYQLFKALTPFTLKNKSLNVPSDLLTLKSPYTLVDDDLNKLIDRIADNINSRKGKIIRLGGYDTAKAYEQKLINKYIKDIDY